MTQFGTIRHTDIKILKNTNPNCLKSTQFEKELCTIYLVLYRTWVFFPSWIWKRNEGMTRFKETKDTFETSTLQYNIMKSPYIGETRNFVKSQFSEWNVQMPQYLQILFKFQEKLEFSNKFSYTYLIGNSQRNLDTVHCNQMNSEFYEILFNIPLQISY